MRSEGKKDPWKVITVIALHFNRARDSILRFWWLWCYLMNLRLSVSSCMRGWVLWTDVFHSFQFYGGSRIFYPYMVSIRHLGSYAWWEKVKWRLSCRVLGHFSIPLLELEKALHRQEFELSYFIKAIFLIHRHSSKWDSWVKLCAILPREVVMWYPCMQYLRMMMMTIPSSSSSNLLCLPGLRCTFGMQKIH